MERLAAAPILWEVEGIPRLETWFGVPEDQRCRQNSQRLDPGSGAAGLNQDACTKAWHRNSGLTSLGGGSTGLDPGHISVTSVDERPEGPPQTCLPVEESHDLCTRQKIGSRVMTEHECRLA